MNKPFITAHTGCMNTTPNTIDSVKSGLKNGGDIVEVDVRATIDLIPILFHDSSIYSSEGKEYKISENTYQTIKGLNPTLTTLEEILPIMAKSKKMINLDLKDEKSIHPMIELLKKHNMLSDVIVTGCDKVKAYEIKKICPEIQVLMNVEENYMEFGDADQIIKKICEDAIGSLCCGLNFDHKYCTKEFVEYAQLRCLPVYIWTVEDKKEMRKFIDMGVDSITTNQVVTLKSLKEELS